MPVGLRLQSFLADIFAGSVASILAVVYSLSYAALIFSGPLTNWLGYGVAMTFLSAAVGAAVVALRSSIPFAVAGPDSSTYYGHDRAATKASYRGAR